MVLCNQLRVPQHPPVPAHPKTTSSAVHRVPHYRQLKDPALGQPTGQSHPGDSPMLCQAPAATASCLLTKSRPEQALENPRGVLGVPTGAVLGPAVGWLYKVLQLLLKLWADHTVFPQELSSSWSPPGLAWDLGPAAWQSKDAATWLGDLGTTQDGSQEPPGSVATGQGGAGNGLLRLIQVWFWQQDLKQL